MIQIIEQTHEEKVKMYMKSTKRKLIEMLIECNKIQKSLTRISFYSDDVTRSNYRVNDYEGGEYSYTTRTATSKVIGKVIK